MGKYFRTPEMTNGGPFRCFNCGRFLFAIRGTDYELEVKCSRCHTTITLRCTQPIPRASELPSDGDRSLPATPVSARR